MKAYDASKIRNVSLLGHSSSGKTMLVESLYTQQALSLGWARLKTEILLETSL